MPLVRIFPIYEEGLMTEVTSIVSEEQRIVHYEFIIARKSWARAKEDSIWLYSRQSARKCARLL